MKTLSNANDRNEVLHRLDNVHADSRARWGAMSCHQMICHLCDSLRSAFNEKSVTPSTTFFRRNLLKPLALWVPMQWPHGVKTLPELDQLQGGTPPVLFASDLDQLRILYDRFCSHE